MLTTDPGDSDECYACKVLEVVIINCHHSLIQVGGGRVTGGWGGNTNGQSDVTVFCRGTAPKYPPTEKSASRSSVHVSTIVSHVPHAYESMD